MVLTGRIEGKQYKSATQQMPLEGNLPGPKKIPK